jgi:hypothetical protein
VDFAPVVYEHAAALIGERPWTVSRDARLLAAAQAAAHRVYGHRPLVLGIDLYNVEPECYGAVVIEPPGDEVPALTGYPLADPAALAQLPVPDWARAGRLPLLLEAAGRLRAELPALPLRVPVCGPFSLAAGLLGFETLLVSLIEAPDLLATGLAHLVEGQLALVRLLAARGLPPLLFESAATPPLVPPAGFAAVELPALRALCQGAAAVLGTGVPLVIGGDTAPLVPQLLATGASALICPVETDQTAFLAAWPPGPAPALRINMDPAVFAAADPAAALAEADRVLTLARRRSGTSVGSGVLPFDAVPATVRAVAARVAADRSPVGV